MKQPLVMKIWSGEKRSWYFGVDIFEWSLPVHIASYGKNQLLVGFLCFYFSVEWN